MTSEASEVGLPNATKAAFEVIDRIVADSVSESPSPLGNVRDAAEELGHARVTLDTAAQVYNQKHVRFQDSLAQLSPEELAQALQDPYIGQTLDYTKGNRSSLPKRR